MLGYLAPVVLSNLREYQLYPLTQPLWELRGWDAGMAKLYQMDGRHHGLYQNLTLLNLSSNLIIESELMRLRYPVEKNCTILACAISEFEVYLLRSDGVEMIVGAENCGGTKGRVVEGYPSLEKYLVAV